MKPFVVLSVVLASGLFSDAAIIQRDPRENELDGDVGYPPVLVLPTPAIIGTPTIFNPVPENGPSDLDRPDVTDASAGEKKWWKSKGGLTAKEKYKIKAKAKAEAKAEAKAKKKARKKAKKKARKKAKHHQSLDEPEPEAEPEGEVGEEVEEAGEEAGEAVEEESNPQRRSDEESAGEKIRAKPRKKSREHDGQEEASTRRGRP